MTRCPRHDRRRPSNPLVNTYRTSDGRFIMLGSLQADRYWPRFCEAIGHPELLEDERFVDADRRRENIEECVQVIDAAFADADARGVDGGVQGGAAAVRRHPHAEGGAERSPGPAQRVRPGPDARHRADAPGHDRAGDLRRSSRPSRRRRRPTPRTPTRCSPAVGYSVDEIMELKINGAIS